MDPMDNNQNLSDLKVSKDAIIETVAEKILSQEKSVPVIDSNQKVVGVVRPSKVIHTVFGGRKREFINLWRFLINTQNHFSGYFY